MEFSEVLTQEHEQIRRALNVIRLATDQIRQGYSVDVHNVNAILLFLHSYGDRCHQAKEESILFPALNRALYDHRSKSAADLEGLIAEHREECNLIEKTQIALFTEDSNFVEHADKLIELVSEHITKEETVLFPSIEQILTESQTATLGVRMLEANANFGECHITLLMDMLKQVELEFGLKAA